MGRTRETAAGWSRDCGTTEIFDVDLVGVRTGTGDETFNKNDPVLITEISPHPSARGKVRSVSLHCHANLRLGGDYKLQLHLRKSEIARLFYLTHKLEIHGLTDILLTPEDDADETT